MSEVVQDRFFRGRPLEQRPKIHHDMERAAHILQGQFPQNMAGFVTIAVNTEGEWAVQFSLLPDGVMGRRMLAGLASEAIREMLVTDACVTDRLEEGA